MNVLVTGATGFLGRHLVRSLIKKNCKVTALVRPTSDCSKLPVNSIEIVKGDLLNREFLVEALKGKEIIFHNAGVVADWGKKELFYRVNVEGTKNLLEASLLNRVKRFIHTSSLTVLGVPRYNSPVNETAPYANVSFQPYTETKIASEKLVLEYHAKKNLPVTIIRPGIIWGPEDTTILPRIEKLAQKGLIFNISRGNNILCLSYIANVVDGIILSAHAPRAEGQIYHIADEDKITSKTFLTELAGILGVRPPTMSIPFPVLYSAALMLEMCASIRKHPQPPLITRYAIYLMGCNYIVDITKAKTELGYYPRISFKKGLEELTLWYRHVSQNAHKVK